MTLTRRGALITGASAGIALPLLAACGAEDSTASDVTTSPTAGSATPAAGSATGAGTGAARPTVPPLAATADIKVGSGKIFAPEKVVVTQPTAGEFKAFDATCTHEGCLVSKIQGSEIVFTCHSSKYSIEDGSVESGPAPKSLPEKAITVADGGIYVS